MSITTSSVHTVRCDECGHAATFGDMNLAQLFDREHRGAHDASRLIGPRLEGKVLDSQTTDTWLGHIDQAIEYARERSFAFLSWNGYVYTTGDYPSSERAICEAKHVPGLTS